MGNPRTRRTFLKRTANAVGAVIAAPVIARAGVIGVAGEPGANDRITIGFIGAGGRGRTLMTQTPKPGEIVAICDVDLSRCHLAVQEKAPLSSAWEVVQDYRRILDRNDIDAVIVPTTDHARVLACIHACQAGKDVYAEKPLTLTIAEGRVLVNAVRKYERVFQTGTQQRSMEFNRYACELVRGGRIGRVHTVLGCNYPGPGVCENLPEEPIPRSIDWDPWCAQTRIKPYNLHLQQRWMDCRDYSGGPMTNWGAHGLDQVQWALGMDGTGPVEIWPASDGPNGKVHMRYANGVLVKLEIPYGGPLMGGAIFLGEEGKIEVRRNDFIATPREIASDAPEPQKREIWEGRGFQAKFHIGNWLDCIRSRKLPVADVEIGHRSITVCHLANIARDLGRKLDWDPDNEVFRGDPEANGYLDRPRRKGYELPDVAL